MKIISPGKLKRELTDREILRWHSYFVQKYGTKDADGNGTTQTEDEVVAGLISKMK